MRCPRCLQNVKESTQQCQCGFMFDNVELSNLQGWFAELRKILENAYIIAPTPWQQSGKSGTFEDWTRLRIVNIAAVERSGTYLDIGCANGYLLECAIAWLKLKNIEIIPYGLDYSAKLIALARQRLPDYIDNFYIGNALTWQHCRRFDYVRTELDYVPINYRQPFIKRLLAEFLTENGRLIISQYRSRHDDLTKAWVDDNLQNWGFQIEKVHSGYSEEGLELTRVIILSNTTKS